MALSLNDYRAMPYSRRSERIHEEDGSVYWVAWIHELTGCKTDGETHAEAMLNLDIAFDDYIKAMMKFGADIPIPERYSIDSIPDKNIARAERPIATIRDLSVPLGEPIPITKEEFERKRKTPIDCQIRPITTTPQPQEHLVFA